MQLDRPRSKTREPSRPASGRVISRAKISDYIGDPPDLGTAARLAGASATAGL